MVPFIDISIIFVSTNVPPVFTVKMIAEPAGAVIAETAAALSSVFNVLVTVAVLEVTATPPTVVAVSIQSGNVMAALAGAIAANGANTNDAITPSAKRFVVFIDI